MATAVYTGSAAPTATATGLSGQNHLVWAPNQAAWWMFYLSGASSLAAKYSTDGTTWSTPSGSPFSLGFAPPTADFMAFACVGISTYDVLHQNVYYGDGGHTWHSRYTLGTTWTRTHSETQCNNQFNNESELCCAISSTGYPYDGTADGSTIYGSAAKATTQDTGSAWTNAWGGIVNVDTSGAQAEHANLIPLASGQMMWIGDNGSRGNCTNLRSNITSSGTWGTCGNVFGSAFTSTDFSAYGTVARTTSDIHAVALSNNSNAYVHAQWNGSSWSAGNSVPTLTLGTKSGIALVTDGTSVWVFAVDSSKNVQYVKWSGSSWGSWTVLEATRTNAPTYVIACINAAGTAIQVAWTELNGSNYEVWTSQLSLSAGTSTGTGSVTLSALTVAGSGGFVSPSAGSVTLAALTMAGSGGFAAPSSGSVSLSALTASGSGAFVAPGTGAIALPALAVAGSSGFVSPGSGSVTLSALAVAGSGGFLAPGAGSVSLPALAVAGSGGFTATSSGSVALAALTVAGSGSFVSPGSGAVALDALTVAGSGTASTVGGASGAGSPVLSALTIAGSGAFLTPGSGAITLPALAVAGSGSFLAVGSGSVALAAPTIAGSAIASTISGSVASGAAVLSALTMAGSGSFTATASGSVVLAALIVAGNSGGVITAYPDPFASTTAVSGSDSFGATVVVATADPFGVTATYKGA